MNDPNHLKELTKKIATNADPQACRDFFNLFYQKLVKFALLFTTNMCEAEDIVSEVFCKIFSQPRKIGKIEDIKIYLYTSVRNQAITHFHRNKKLPDTLLNEISLKPEQVERKTPETHYFHKELFDIVEEVIDHMPSKRKIIYSLIVIDGLKYKEVAKLLSISQKTVESHMRMAVREMRHKILASYQHESLTEKEFFSK